MLIIFFLPWYRYFNHTHVRLVRAEKCWLCASLLAPFYWPWAVWVSTWMGIMIYPHVPLLILWYTVGSTEWKKWKTLEYSHTHRLRCRIESGKVSTSPWHSVRVYISQTFIPSEPSVRASRGLWSWRDIPTLTPHRLWNSLGWTARLRFTCLRYDALQIYCPSPPSFKWSEHFGLFFCDGELHLSRNPFSNPNPRGNLLRAGFTFSF